MTKIFIFIAILLGSAVFFMRSDLNDILNDSKNEVSQYQSHWFKGSVDEAFASALETKKLVLLYWGAEWCPPCHELKNNVFSHPEFPELASDFVPVYLDGDLENAQVWGDKLDVSGYPTVLLLEVEKASEQARGQSKIEEVGDKNLSGFKTTELARLGSGLLFSEFKQALRVAKNSNVNVEAFAERLLSDKDFGANIADEEYEYIANFPENLEDAFSLVLKAKNDSVESEEIDALFLKSLLELDTVVKETVFDQWDIEKNSSVYRKFNIAIFVRILAKMKSDDTKFWLDRDGLKKNATVFARKFLKTKNFQNPDFLWDAREILSYEFQSVREDLLPEVGLDDKDVNNTLAVWLTSMQKIHDDPRASAGVKLWSYLPLAEFLSLSSDKTSEGKIDYASIPDVLEAGDYKVEKNAIKKGVLALIPQLNTKHQRGSVISGAGYLLSSVGMFSDAITVLENEIKVTTTPWYFYRSLASVASKMDDKENQLKWSRLAAETAVGEATRLQWLSLDIKTLSDTGADREIIYKTIEDFFAMSEKIQDSFVGRNLGAQERVSKVIKKLATSSSDEAIDTATSISPSKYCEKLEVVNSEKCSKVYL